MAQTGIMLAAAGAMLGSAYADARRFRIPNIASLALLALFPAYIYFSSEPFVWESHVAAFVLVLVVGFYLFVKNYVGAGDIKLLAALSLWAGLDRLGILLVVTTLTGGVLAVFIAAVTYIRQRKLDPEQAVASVIKTPIPYGVAIAVGGLCTLMSLSHPALLP